MGNSSYSSDRNLPLNPFMVQGEWYEIVNSFKNDEYLQSKVTYNYNACNRCLNAEHASLTKDYDIKRWNGTVTLLEDRVIETETSGHHNKYRVLEVIYDHYMVLGSHCGTHVWVLARCPQVDCCRLKKIESTVRRLGFKCHLYASSMAVKGYSHSDTVTVVEETVTVQTN